MTPTELRDLFAYDRWATERILAALDGLDHQTWRRSWALPFLVPVDDGTHRLPADAGGELPLVFSILATKAA